VTLTFDLFYLWVNACRATAVEYTCAKFGVDTQAVFLLERGQTDIQFFALIFPIINSDGMPAYTLLLECGPACRKLKVKGTMHASANASTMLMSLVILLWYNFQNKHGFGTVELLNNLYRKQQNITSYVVIIHRRLVFNKLQQCRKEK